MKNFTTGQRSLNSTFWFLSLLTPSPRSQTGLPAISWNILSRFLNLCHCSSSMVTMTSTLFLDFAIIYKLFKVYMQSALWTGSIPWPLPSCWKWFLPLVKFWIPCDLYPVGGQWTDWPLAPILHHHSLSLPLAAFQPAYVLLPCFKALEKMETKYCNSKYCMFIKIL